MKQVARIHIAALLVLSCLVLMPVHADEDAAGFSRKVNSTLWSSPRNAAAIAAEPAIAAAVEAWHAQPRRVIVVRHAPGETGLLRAEELRDWLVALGVPSQAVDVRAGEDVGDRLQLRVR